MSTTPAHESEVTQSPVRKQRSGPARVYSQDECASHEDTERGDQFDTLFCAFKATSNSTISFRGASLLPT